jgi:flavodoxin
MKKILVVYYSKTGNTKKIAEKIAKLLNADLDEIVVKGNHMPFQKKFEMTYKKNPSDYDLVAVGTPVWSFGPPPALKRYLIKNKIKKVAFFCTYNGILGLTFKQMEKLSKKPLATLKIIFNRFNKKEEKDWKNKLEKFCEELR